MLNFRRSLQWLAPVLLAITFASACTQPAPPVAPVEGEGKLVEHAVGETVVPKQPKRVVVLSQNALDYTLALGIKPVGASYAGFASRADYGDFPDYLAQKAQDIENVGHAARPNLEKILQLEPDLILGNKTDHQGIYNQLSQIAPTVLATYQSEENFQLYASALGKTETAAALQQDFQQRLAEFRQEMGDRLETTEVSVLRFRPDQVRLYMKDSFAGYVLEQAGLPRPLSQDKDKTYETVSIEAIPEMDGDVIFYFQDNPDSSMATKVMEHPLWSQLDAVERGRVYEVSFDAWFLGNGILAANRVLDDLFKYLVEMETPTTEAQN
jgi:iron complex transport system substrate-binding protein